MGTRGMSYSLQSRDLIADSIETVTCGQWYDANVSIPGCDKNMPGVMMAIGRMNRPALMVYGGTIRAGRVAGGQPVDIVNAFQSYGQYLAGSIDDGQRFEIVRNACPGAGRVRRHVHREHDGVGDRGDGHVAPLQLLHSRRGPRASSTSASGWAPRSASCSRRT